MLRRTLPGLLAQSFQPTDYEVVIAVDGSTDGTLGFLRAQRPACGWQVIELPHRGLLAARNAALAAARGEIVLLLDDDVVSTTGLVAAHVAAHEGSARRVAIGPLAVDEASPRTVATGYMRGITERWLAGMKPHAAVPETHHVFDPNTSVRRELLRECGGFDETTPRFREALDMGLRLRALGAEFCYEPRANATHFYCKSATALLREELQGKGESEVALCRKHPAWRSRSPLAGVNSWRDRLRRAIARLASPPVLHLSARAADVLFRIGLRRLGQRMLSATLFAAQRRGAARACGGWRRLQREFSRPVSALCYHRVGPPRPGAFPSLTVSAEQFREQLEWLREHDYTGITAGDWLAWREGRQPLPAKPVILTFDDAYADIAEHALPLVREFGWRATVFTVTGAIDGVNHWDMVNGSASLALMTADEMRRWQDAGIEFAPHSQTHRDLTLLDDAELREEIAGSARDLEALLGVKARVFAYPYGAVDERVRRAALAYFEAAFTVRQRRNCLGDDAGLLRRTMVRPTDGLATFAMRVRWGIDPVEVLRNHVAGWVRRVFRRTASATHAVAAAAMPSAPRR